MDEELLQQQRQFYSDPSHKQEAVRLLKQARRSGGFHVLPDSVLHNCLERLDPKFFWRQDRIRVPGLEQAAKRSTWPIGLYFAQVTRPIAFDSEDQLKACLERYGPRLRHVYLHYPPSPTTISWLSHCQGLKTLRLSLTLGDDGELPSLAGLKALRQLYIYSGPSLYPHGLECLFGLEELHTLSLQGFFGNTRDRFHGLHRFPKLKRLALSGIHIQDSEIEALKDHPSLTELSLTGCRKLTDRVMHTLASLTRLKSLTLSSYERFSSQGIQPLKTLQKIETLILSGFEQLCTEDFETVFLAGKSLRVLSLEHCPALFRPPSQVLDKLRSQNSLTELGLNVEELTEASWNSLGQRNSLEKLNLRGEVTVAQLRCLTGLEKLSRLDIELGHFNAASLDTLRHITALKELKVRDCHSLEEQIIPALVAFEALKSFEMNHCELSAEAVRPLSLSKSLETLILQRCKNMSLEQQQRLVRECRPGLVFLLGEFDSQTNLP